MTSMLTEEKYDFRLSRYQNQHDSKKHQLSTIHHTIKIIKLKHIPAKTIY